MEKSSLIVDRTAFSVTSLSEQQADERRYWLSRTPHERLKAVETTRQIVYGYDPASTKIQKFRTPSKGADSFQGSRSGGQCVLTVGMRGNHVFAAENLPHSRGVFSHRT